MSKFWTYVDDKLWDSLTVPTNYIPEEMVEYKVIFYYDYLAVAVLVEAGAGCEEIMGKEALEQDLTEEAIRVLDRHGITMANEAKTIEVRAIEREN